MEGCGLVAFLEPESTPGFSFLRQESQNPVVYSKLSCHLPWIAEQYDMDFDAVDTDPESLEAVGSEEVSEEDTRECRAVSPEEKCIFPFYLNGERYDSCAMMEQDGFLFRVYLCPMYNRSYLTVCVHSMLLHLFCLTQPIKTVTPPEELRLENHHCDRARIIVEELLG